MSDEQNGTVPKTANPFSKTLMLALSIRLLGVSRKVESNVEGVEIDADSDLVSVNKKLLQCDEYDAIKTRISQLKSALKRMSMPGANKLFKGGTYAIVKSKVQDAEMQVRQAKKELPPLFDAFCKIYPQRRDEAIARLSSLGNMADYPTPETVRRAFGVKYEWIQLGVAEGLQAIDPDIFQGELAKQAAKVAQIGDQAIGALTLQVQEAINNFADALKPAEGGKKRVVATPLKKLREILDTYKEIFEGTDLQAVSTKLAAIVGNVDTESLRDSAATRKLVEKRVAEAKKDIDKVVGLVGIRKFRTEEE